MPDVRSTQLRRLIRAPRSRIYQTMLDPLALARWKVPDGMTLEVHQFEPREGGNLRISLTYDAPSEVGKTTAHTDTYRGRFLRLVPNELIVEADEFETDDPALRGEMITTIRLTDAEDGTVLVATHDGVPPGVALADNETGWNMALDKLEALVTRPS
jgi:uncharacterized protein YndB with AHSA1/START domain